MESNAPKNIPEENPQFFSVLETPYGFLGYTFNRKSEITRLVLPGYSRQKLETLLEGDPKSKNTRKPLPVLDRKLSDYFSGKRSDLRLKVDWTLLTPFQKKVLETVYQIPHGEVKTYEWVGRKIGKPRSARAVGNALSKNPIPLVIPCHRVIRADGKLGGFSALKGIPLKKALLELETGAF